MFVITFDSKFRVDAAVTCTSYTTGNAINYYNSTGAGVHDLDCQVTAIASTHATGAVPVYTA